MTETLTIRLPKSLARDFRAKTRSAKTNPAENYPARRQWQAHAVPGSGLF
jgi:hypothetical protein